MPEKGINEEEELATTASQNVNKEQRCCVMSTLFTTITMT